jgi:hypothetical protein
VLGYVSTSYGARPLQDVCAEIERWYAWYAVDGIFLDEAAAEAAQLAYFRSVSHGIRSSQAARVVALNPGTQPAEEYMDLCDIVVNYEGTWAGYRTVYSDNPAWVGQYAAARFWHIVHDCPTPIQAATILELAQRRNAGWVFFTDAGGANPYSRLPAANHWAAQLHHSN